MKVIIFGGGAVGSVLAALLSRNNDVTLIGREEHVKNINENGLKLKGVITRGFPLKAKTKLESVEEDTLLILTTKAYDVETALVEIKPLLKPDAVVLCVQNGYGVREAAKKIITDNEVIFGTTSIASTFLEPGIVSYFGGSTRLERTNSADKVCDVFNNCGLKAKISDNINEDIWRKLVINCVLNPLTTILGIKNGEVADPKLREIKKNILNECVLIANKEGVSIKLDIEALDSFVAGSENISSMLQDMMKQKKTEIDFINGAIVKLAEKHNVDVPVNKSMVSMIRFLEC